MSASTSSSSCGVPKVVPNKVEQQQRPSSCSGAVITAASQGSSAVSWKATLTWAGAIVLWYAFVQLLLLPLLLAPDPDARALLLSQVPIRFYQYSEAAFFTAAVLNVISFLFEETQEKRQLALLAALIKGLSWHCDYLIVTGQAVITFDAYGALLLPSRYVQWSCTTPTMLFTLSKISDFSNQQVALVVVCDWIMILTGYIAAVYPPGPISYLALAVSFVTMYYVLYSLYLMIQSALAEASSPHAKFSLRFTLWSSMAIWHLFPLAWCAARMGPSLSRIGEPLALAANFGAKLVFSSCILFNNYVTLQQRRIVAQLEQEHRDRIRLVEELKTAVRSKDDFISVIGHELRTPLNAIIQLSAAVMSSFGAPGTWQKHYVWMETIARSAKHLLGIINDIITIKAARSGMHMKQELVSVARAVDHVARTLSPMAKRGVLVEKSMMKNLPPIVADERRIIQLLSNLLSNALKFTDRGKVSVRVSVDAGARNVVIKVQDTGCGIPKKELKNLVVPFKQVDMSSSRKYGGTGLGLSIANELVLAHSGTMELDSVEGKGTTVVVKLPVLQPETHAVLEAPFKAAYVGAGFSFEELMSSEVALVEKRRVPAFRSSSSQALRLASSKATSARTSVDSNGNGMQVEQFYWDDYYEDNLGPEGTESAAASGLGGPPPLAVALVSALYQSSAPPVVAAQSPSPHGGGHSPSPAWSQAVAVAAAAAPPPRQSSRQSAPLPSVPGSPHEYCGPSAANSGSFAVQDGGGGWGAGPDSSSAAPQSSTLTPLGEDAGEQVDYDEWAGSWHRAPRFGDDFDDSHKEYYAYDNRLSYEYRPSMDQSAGGGSGQYAQYGHSGQYGQRTSPQAVKAAFKPAVSSVFRRISMSLHPGSFRRPDSVRPRSNDREDPRGRAGWHVSQGPAAGLGLGRGGEEEQW